MACKPDEHWRLTVRPDTSVGRPRPPQVVPDRVTPRGQRVSGMMADGQPEVLQLPHLQFQPVPLATHLFGPGPGDHVGMMLDRGQQTFGPGTGRCLGIQSLQPRVYRVQLVTRQDVALSEGDPRVCPRILQGDTEDGAIPCAKFPQQRRPAGVAGLGDVGPWYAGCSDLAHIEDTQDPDGGPERAA